MDKSKQGHVDPDIIPLLDALNSKGYETTSSCSGRIVLLGIPSPGDKKNAEWLFKTHGKADADRVAEALEGAGRRLYLLQEPAIIHANCRDMETAGKLLGLAREAGFKHSGIISLKNFTVEIRGSERLETLVVPGMDRDYLAELVEEANIRLEKTKKKLEKLELLIGSRK